MTKSTLESDGCSAKRTHGCKLEKINASREGIFSLITEIEILLVRFKVYQCNYAQINKNYLLYRSFLFKLF